MTYVQEQVRSEGMCEPTIFQVTSLCDIKFFSASFSSFSWRGISSFSLLLSNHFSLRGIGKNQVKCFLSPDPHFFSEKLTGATSKGTPPLFFLQINQKCRFFLVHLMWGFPSPSVLSLALAFIHTVRLQLQIVIPGERPLTQAG